jgi:fatty-acyl-CoA synthase
MTTTHRSPGLPTGQTLSEIEAVPLAERGLASSTYALMRNQSHARPLQPALRLLPGGDGWEQSIDITYGQLTERVSRVANALRSMGVERDTAVTLVSPNCGWMVAALLGAETAGIAAPVNPVLAPDQIVALVHASGSDVIIAAGPEFGAGIWDGAVALGRVVGARHVLALRPDGATGPAPSLVTNAGGPALEYLSVVADRADPQLSFAEPHPEDIAAYVHTGGTTASPKLAALSHENQVITSWSIATASGVAEGATMLAGLPLFHVNALLVSVLAPLHLGATTVWIGPLGFRDPMFFANAWRMIERYRVEGMSAVPVVYARLAQIPLNADVSSLKVAAVGASPLPDAVRAAFRHATGVELTEGYGLTEATCASTVTRPGGYRPGTVGERLPYQQIAAFRRDGGANWTRLPDGEQGTIRIAGSAVFRGYVVTDGADRHLERYPWVQEGWLDTGDLGSVEDGFLSLRGRAKDVIIRGGHNIDPAVIEQALLQHPAVTGAAAVGRPDVGSGEVPVAYITGPADPAVVRTWLETQPLEPAAQPKAIYSVDAIPVTEVGKPFKPALREDAAARAVSDALQGRDVENGLPPHQEVRVRDVAGVLTVDTSIAGEGHAARIAAIGRDLGLAVS